MDLLNKVKTVQRLVAENLTKRKVNKLIQASPHEYYRLPVGEDAYRVALYFADSPENLYQLRQWYEPLKQLNAHVPVVVIVRNPVTAVEIQEECPVPLYLGRTIADVEQMLQVQPFDVVFYVNQNIRNFQMLRFGQPTHVFVSHGESEKAYMWSNQLKAYDLIFAAGEAARQRLGKNLTGFDAEDRTRLIGRPQLDVHYPCPVALNPEFPTVLYAPTWEGDRPSMGYGSVRSHGVQLMKKLVESEKYNIIFRPHPRSGINETEYGQAVAQIRTLLERPEKAGEPILFFDDSDSWGWQWDVADLCITDMSAVAYDWLATGKPLLVTQPTSPDAILDDSPALLKVPGLNIIDVPETPSIVENLLDANNTRYSELVEHYFGDTSPNASMTRFITETLALIKA